jgi:hypothetical protein
MSEKIPFPRFQNYLRGVFKRTADTDSWLRIQSFSKWILDLFRNAMIVGVLKYFSDKSGTWVLWVAEQVA